MTTPRPPRPPPKTSEAHGPHTGRLLLKLPVTDLTLPNAGVWNGRVSFKKSGLAAFQGETVLRAFYQKGSGTSSDPHHDASGMSVTSEAVPIVGAKALVVAFDIYFDPARWHWSRGGKLGGIFVGTGKASGGRHSDDGASHRIMWQEDGGAISYVYPPAGLPQRDPKLKASNYGIGYHHQAFQGALKAGQWNHVEIGVKLNSFRGGKPAMDGKAVLTVNGVTAALDGINWSKSPDIQITSFEYNTFFGGPDPARVDSVAYTKNYEVYEWRD